MDARYTDYGLHAAAYAINAHVANPGEMEVLFDRVFNDPVTICSWSPFNQYWILQALSNMGNMDRAIETAKLCWGDMAGSWLPE